MAQVFLSYARENLSAANRIAAALEAAGHSVWWDRHINAGSRFSAEIAEALKAADLVVVLWSPAAIDSPWVQDEAAFGRDHGRLVPALLGPIQPPLGFRQYQSVPVGKAGRKPEPLLAAVAEKLGQPGAVSKRARARPGLLDWRWITAVAAALTMAVGVWLGLPRGADGPSHVVAVAAAEGGNQRLSRELARSIAVDLGRFRTGSLGSLTILGSGHDADDADYRVEVGVAEAGKELRADVSLLTPNDSKLLWTTTEQGPASGFVDLRQRAVAKLGDVLRCAVEASATEQKLKPDVLGLYLTGCGQMSDLMLDRPNQETFNIYRQVTERAPNFAPGWANLALIEAYSFAGTPPSERAALHRDLVTHLAKAKQLDPTLPATIAADAYFHPNDGTKPAHALALLDRGLERHPDSALLHDLRSNFLAKVGRMNDAVTAAQRAVALNPLSPTIRDSYISSLAYGGRIEAALGELRKADAIWPGSTVLKQVGYRLNLRYGDPKAALRQLIERGSGDLRPVPGDTAWLAFLDARISPSAANVEKALADFRARYRSDPAHIASYGQALGTFGRVEEAYEVVWHPVALDSLMAGTEALFRPHMRAIRADPRFIALAAKLGLLQYWEKTGLWADFCSEPRLPYDCRKEAAKLTPEQRKLARLIVG